MIVNKRLTVLAIFTMALGEMLGCSEPDEPGPRRSASQGAPNRDSELPRRLEAKGLPNAIQIHARVISGGQPEGAAAFQELSSLGVKTIISVDGAKPQVGLAAKHGLRYVHLPHGYNGIPQDRAEQLALAVRDLEGKIYIHCHHGKHRSPAAAVVACVANGMLDQGAATAVLKLAGTSANYKGLYQSADSARRIDDSVLDALTANFPEIARLPPLAEAMVELEHTHDHLKRIAAADWKSPANEPDLEPAHEALLLTEHFAEMLRMDSVAQEPADFGKMLAQSERDARELEKRLSRRENAEIVSSAEINSPFERLSANCTACHRQFRDVPLGNGP
jgi:protein tyrosine phosphatase (PTP) superfamily phosphohydrolase (DUF442 family)